MQRTAARRALISKTQPQYNPIPTPDFCTEVTYLLATMLVTLGY